MPLELNAFRGCPAHRTVEGEEAKPVTEEGAAAAPAADAEPEQPAAVEEAAPVEEEVKVRRGEGQLRTRPTPDVGPGTGVRACIQMLCITDTAAAVP